MEDPTAAAKQLVDHALSRFSTDNLSCMFVRLDKPALLESQNNKDDPLGIEKAPQSGKSSEADKIVAETKQKISEGDAPAVGVSPSLSVRGDGARGRSDDGHGSGVGDIKGQGETAHTPALDGTLEEEPSSIEEGTNDSPEVATDAASAPKEAEAAKTGTH